MNVRKQQRTWLILAIIIVAVFVGTGSLQLSTDIPTRHKFSINCFPTASLACSQPSGTTPFWLSIMDGGSVTLQIQNSYDVYSSGSYINYVFDHWLVTVQGIYAPSTYNTTLNPCTVTGVYGESWATAYFTTTATPPFVQPTFNVQANQGGQISVSPSGSYSLGQSVTLTATPSSGSGTTWVFSEFLRNGGDAKFTNPATYTGLQSGETFTAVFAISDVSQNAYLTVSVLPSGSGTTDKQSGYFALGSSVTVSETANSGFRLDHWLLDGSNSGSSPTTTVTMDGNHTLIAYFVSTGSNQTTNPRLTVYVDGSGTVSQGNGTFTSGTALSITATPTQIAGGTNKFSYWLLDGALFDARSNPMSVTMGNDHVLIAVFKYTASSGIWQIDPSTITMGAITVLVVIAAFAVIKRRKTR